MRKQVKSGYLECGNEQIYRLGNPFVSNQELLHPRHVLSPDDKKTPVEPIILGNVSRKQRSKLGIKGPYKPSMSFEFHGTFYEILQQQFSLIKKGTPYYLYATSNIDDINWAPKQTVKIHVKSTGGFTNKSAHGHYMSAVSGGGGIASGFTEFLGGDLSSGFQLAGGETAVYGDNGFDASQVLVQSAHGSARKKVTKKPKHRVHKGYEKWIEKDNKRPLLKKVINTFFRTKHRLVLCLDLPARVERSGHVYDTGRVTHKPINISLQLIYMLTNGIASQAATDAELAALNYHILKDELPPHMRLEELVSDAVVLIGDEVCHVASILDFFSKTQSRETLLVIDELKQQIDQMTSAHAGDPNIDTAATKVLYERVKALAIKSDANDSVDLIDRECKLLRAVPHVERLLQTQIDEIKRFAYSGELPDGIEALANTDTFDDKVYQQSYEVIYFSRHTRLPQAMTDRQLTAFKKYTQTGVMPSFLEEGVAPISVKDVTSDIALLAVAQNRSGLFSSDATNNNDLSEAGSYSFTL